MFNLILDEIMFLNKKSIKINKIKTKKKKNLLINIQPATDALLF